MIKFQRYLKIFVLVVKSSFMKMSAYRFDFFLGFVSTAAYNVGAVLFLKFILAKIDSLAGWDVYDMIFMYGFGQFWTYAYFFITFPNSYDFNSLISEGDMDFILLKPVNSMFMAMFRKVDFLALIAFIQPLAIVYYAISNKQYNITPLSILIALILIVLATILTHLVETIFCSTAFWIVHNEFSQMFFRTAPIATYPYEIFNNKYAKFIFFTIVPYALIINVPFRTLINQVDYRLISLMIAVVIFFFILAQFVWKQGLKRYQSASS